MAFLRPLLLLCFLLPSSNSIKCFTCIGSVSFQFCSTHLSIYQLQGFSYLLNSFHSTRVSILFSLSSTSDTPAWAPSVRETRSVLLTSTTASSGVSNVYVKLNFGLHNLIVDWESGTRTSTITTVAVPMAFLDGRRTMRLTLEAVALLTWPKVKILNYFWLSTIISLSGDAYNTNQEFQEVSWKYFKTILSIFQISGNTKGLKCKEGILDGQIRLRWFCQVKPSLTKLIWGVSAHEMSATTTRGRRWARTSACPTSTSSGSASPSLSFSSFSPALFAQSIKSITQDDIATQYSFWERKSQDLLIFDILNQRRQRSSSFLVCMKGNKNPTCSKDDDCHHTKGGEERSQGLTHCPDDFRIPKFKALSRDSKNSQGFQRFCRSYS